MTTPPQVPRERPERRCDVVMKGGITSGVVYPWAVCELARVYKLQNVGGTSAGAIAAGAAAAAEYGRAQGGYDQLADLPDFVADNLAGLFQAQKATRQPFRILMKSMTYKRFKVVRTILATVRACWFVSLLGAAPGVALAVFADDCFQFGADLVVAAIGVTIALALRLKRIVMRGITGNGFGMCSGMPGHKSAVAALTPWLAGLINRAAGRAEDAPPLTFGDLWAGPKGTGSAKQPWLQLAMMTTNVTNHRAEQLPRGGRDTFFDPAEFRRLFPEGVVAHLEAYPPALPDQPAALAKETALRERLLPLRPLPAPADLPVIVATRMSLSFPVLLSAVPLWRVDYGNPANQTGAPTAERCWFSDGGISSNFPLQFFDALLPQHPTVGLNLRPFPPGQEPSTVQADNVWTPDSYGGGRLDWWYRFDGNITGFLANVVRTMQNRIDDAQMRVPGQRDRIAHVQLTDIEGGMNLRMPREVIEDLTERGRVAGERLADRFGTPPAEPGALSWGSHRWVRLRVALQATADALAALAGDYAEPADGAPPAYGDMLVSPDPPNGTSYPLGTGGRTTAQELMRQVQTIAASVDATALATDAPKTPQSLKLAD